VCASQGHITSAHRGTAPSLTQSRRVPTTTVTYLRIVQALLVQYSYLPVSWVSPSHHPQYRTSQYRTSQYSTSQYSSTAPPSTVLHGIPILVLPILNNQTMPYCTAQANLSSRPQPPSLIRSNLCRTNFYLLLSYHIRQKKKTERKKPPTGTRLGTQTRTSPPLIHSSSRKCTIFFIVPSELCRSLLHPHCLPRVFFVPSLSNLGLVDL